MPNLIAIFTQVKKKIHCQAGLNSISYKQSLALCLSRLGRWPREKLTTHLSKPLARSHLEQFADQI